MLSSDNSPNISNTCYEVMPFSLTHLLATVGVAVCWSLGGRAGDSLVRWGVRKVVWVAVSESFDLILYKWCT